MGLKFPKIRSPRRRGFIVNKNLTKNLKLKLPVKPQPDKNKDLKTQKTSKYIRKGFELTKDPVKKINNISVQRDLFS